MGPEDVLRRFVEALNAADWDGTLACLDEDVVLDQARGGREIGRAAFRERLAALARRARWTLGDVVVLTAPDGLHAAMEFTLRGEGTGEGGASFSLPGGLFLEVSDGRITRISERAGLFRTDGFPA